MTNVVLTPHIGGATYDTEANHSTLVADDIARLLRRRAPRPLRQPGGAVVSSPTHEAVLQATHDMVAQGPRVRAPRATCRAACPTATW